MERQGNHACPGRQMSPPLFSLRGNGGSEWHINFPWGTQPGQRTRLDLGPLSPEAQAFHSVGAPGSRLEGGAGAERGPLGRGGDLGG